jgi:hypothetical protein
VKNSTELHECAKLLEIQVLKIGRILSTWWMALTHCLILDTWKNSEALVPHIKKKRERK